MVALWALGKGGMGLGVRGRDRLWACVKCAKIWSNLRQEQGTVSSSTVGWFVCLPECLRACYVRAIYWCFLLFPFFLPILCWTLNLVGRYLPIPFRGGSLIARVGLEKGYEFRQKK
jgi:hypothetical protein